MQIKVTKNGEVANVQVVHPGTEEISTDLDLTDGQSVTLTCTNEHEASGITVGEVEGADPGAGGGQMPPGDGEAPTG